MADIQEETLKKMRRSLGLEFVRMEDDFDKTRDARNELSDKLMTAARSVNLVSENGGVDDETDTKLRVISTALKALGDIENANAKAIGLKLKQAEQDIASSAATKDRIAIVLRATAPGRIEEAHSTEDLSTALDKMFEGDIHEYELKSNPRDLTDG
jgi:hypothetical protein